MLYLQLNILAATISASVFSRYDNGHYYRLRPQGSPLP